MESIHGQHSQATLPSGSISAAVLEFSEQRVLADRMLHWLSLADARYPSNAWGHVPVLDAPAQGTASGGIVSAMLAIFSAQLGSLA